MTECETNEKPCPSTTVSEPNESTIELEPFIHQVGGRSAILVLGDYICKPVNERELAFYESLDRFAPLLKPFVPRYNGVISVNFAEIEGYLVITTKSSSLQESPGLNQQKIATNTTTPNHEAAETITQTNNNSCVLQSPNSPYQKFVTKYRIKLCRPLREIIIESHEQDVENDVSLDLECSKKQLESLILSKDLDSFDQSTTSSTITSSYQSSTNSTATIISTPSSHTSTNLSRSRSTSISIPNFEDAGQNGFSPNHHLKTNSPQFSRQSSVHSSPSKKVIYHKSTTKHNPWVLKTFSSLSEFNDSMKEQRFIMLENLVANFEYPCIMDLKMGTRQHDFDATESKKQSHESKVNETTSGALGLRITGIQIYDKNLDRFICYNKYYGRKLTPESFRASLKKFVSNENFVAHNLLDKLIEKLKQLRSVIVQLDTFRFYTSSLLLIYEGNACKSSPVDCFGARGDNIENGVRCCATHQADTLIDVRVIDFAHSTHGHINNNVAVSSSSTASRSITPEMSKGYDEGFVFGLDNLIKIFTLFKNEST